MAKKKVETIEETVEVNDIADEIALLREQLEALKAENERLQEASIKPVPKLPTNDFDERVEVMVPVSDLNTSPIYISVNGYNALVRRGETVSLPKPLANVLKRSIKMEALAQQRANELRKRSKLDD